MNKLKGPVVYIIIFIFYRMQQSACIYAIIKLSATLHAYMIYAYADALHVYDKSRENLARRTSDFLEILTIQIVLPG